MDIQTNKLKTQDKGITKNGIKRQKTVYKTYQRKLKTTQHYNPTENWRRSQGLTLIKQNLLHM